MAEFEIKNPPEYKETTEKLSMMDRGHPDTFNPLFGCLLNNDAFLNKNKADKSKIEQMVLVAAGWAGNAAPYYLTLPLAGAKVDNVIEILPRDFLTTEQANTLSAAMIISGSQADGSVTLYAYGDKPLIDIPVTIIVRGDV